MTKLDDQIAEAEAKVKRLRKRKALATLKAERNDAISELVRMHKSITSMPEQLEKLSKWKTQEATPRKLVALDDVLVQLKKLNKSDNEK